MYLSAVKSFLPSQLGREESEDIVQISDSKYYQPKHSGDYTMVSLFYVTLFAHFKKDALHPYTATNILSFPSRWRSDSMCSSPWRRQLPGTAGKIRLRNMIYIPQAPPTWTLCPGWGPEVAQSYCSLGHAARFLIPWWLLGSRMLLKGHGVFIGSMGHFSYLFLCCKV